MKIPNRRGEFYFKALVGRGYVIHNADGTTTNNPQGFDLSEKFFSSKEAAENFYNHFEDAKIIWPAEFIDRNCIYVPTKEEMEEEE